MAEHTADNDAPVCKHCGLTLKFKANGSNFVHAEGLQSGLYRCAADPYGFNAEVEGEECGRTCNGSRGIDPTRVYPLNEAERA